MSEGLAPLQVTGAAPQSRASVTPKLSPRAVGGRESRLPERAESAAALSVRRGEQQFSVLPTQRGHCSSERLFLSCEAGQEGGRCLLIPLPSPLTQAKRARGRAHPPCSEDWSAAASPKTRALFWCALSSPAFCTSSFPLPSAPPFVSLTPSLRVLAGHPFAVHLVPLWAFPLRLPRGGSSGGRRTETSTSVAGVSPARRAHRKALAGDLHRIGGGNPLSNHTFSRLWSKTICFAFHLSFLKGESLSRGIGLRNEV